jgi:hypothetical protein
MRASGLDRATGIEFHARIQTHHYEGRIDSAKVTEFFGRGFLNRHGLLKPPSDSTVVRLTPIQFFPRADISVRPRLWARP